MNRATIAFALAVPALLATGCLPPAISDGKFYAYCHSSPCPPDQIADVNASPEGFTAGSKLTDGVVAQPAANQPANTWYWGSDSPGQHPERDKWVEWGWGHDTEPVNVIVDLGKSYTLTHFSIDSTSFTPYGIAYPIDVTVYVGDIPNPRPANHSYSITLPAFPANCTTSCPESWQIPRTTVTAAVPQGTTVTGRYVKFQITTAGPQVNTLIDEVTVRGPIDNPQRFVPAGNNVYHGAFSVNPPEANGGNLSPSYFQNLVGKNLASYIWYDGFNPSTISLDLQILEIYHPRALQLGWEPRVTAPPGGTVVDAVINGSWDTYIKNFFTTFANRLGTGSGKLNTPLFLRFASEMNGNWMPYSGVFNHDPGTTNGPKKYVAMWRRVYNIAQQVGATNPGNVLFAWAPGSLSFPSGAGNEWNSFANYYPGDQYVEWVGVDMYSGDPDDPNNPGNGLEPSSHIQPVYNAYAARKPMMIAETGGCPTIPPPLGDPYTQPDNDDKATYVNHLFTQLNTSFPNVKAVYWFNAYDHGFCDFSLDSTQDVPAHSALEEYRDQIANPRYISTIQGN